MQTDGRATIRALHALLTTRAGRHLPQASHTRAGDGKCGRKKTRSHEAAGFEDAKL
jgi:uncharacterized low-complexity protein